MKRNFLIVLEKKEADEIENDILIRAFGKSTELIPEWFDRVICEATAEESERASTDDEKIIDSAVMRGTEMTFVPVPDMACGDKDFCLFASEMRTLRARVAELEAALKKTKDACSCNFGGWNGAGTCKQPCDKCDEIDQALKGGE